MISEVRSHQLPLFGHFCCRLAAQPDCVSREVISGPLWVPQWPGHEPAWAQLQAFNLHLWPDREAWLQGVEPLEAITVDKVNVFIRTYLSHLRFIIYLEHSMLLIYFKILLSIMFAINSLF